MEHEISYRTKDVALKAAIEHFISEWESGIAHFEVQTSGSTGVPKTIILSRNQLIGSAQRTLDFFQLQPGNTALLGISPKTIGGKMMLVRAIIGKLKLVVCDPSSNPLTVLELDEYLDFCPMVPLQIQTILATDSEKLQFVKILLFGGAPLSAHLEKQLQQLDCACFHGFGMTETVSHIAMRKVGQPTYSAMKGVQFSEEGTQLVISDAVLGIQQLRTTDSVELIDNEHFNWLGRTDYVINSGGVKIHPEQLEQLLEGFINGSFFISAEPDDTFGQKCIIIVDETTETPSLEEIQHYCKQKFGRYAAPKKIYRTNIVYNQGSKINRLKTLQQLGIKA